MADRTRILFVCLGNICRSPSAEGVFRQVARKHGLLDQLEIDSCGTGAWHVGKPPDARAMAAAGRRGIDLGSLRARQISVEDLDHYDYILVMDRQNLADVRDLWRQNGGTEPELFLGYSNSGEDEVPDPYYGGDNGFEQVLDLIEDASEGLIRVIREQQA